LSNGLTITAGNATINSASFIAKIAATSDITQNNILVMQDPSAQTRWTLGYTNANADFGIVRYVNGASVDKPININYTTGAVTVANTARTYVYTTYGPHTLIVPVGYTTVTVEAIGGGGAGGTASDSSGAGGGGSSFLKKATLGVSTGLTITSHVGIGGAPSLNYFTVGGAGGDSVVAVGSISTIAAGGQGGQVPNGGNGGIIGQAGLFGVGGAGGFGTTLDGYSGVGGGGPGGVVNQNGSAASPSMYGAGGGGGGMITFGQVFIGGAGIGGYVRITLY
jgi:hypothetical protein